MSEWGRGYDQGHAEAEKVYKPTIAALEQRVREAEEALEREHRDAIDREFRWQAAADEDLLRRAEAAEREAAALREENERLKPFESEWKHWLREANARLAERDALRLRLAECEGTLEALVDRCMELNLSECEPALGRARDALSSSQPSPVSALIEVGRLAVHLVEKIKHKATGGFAPDAYEEWDELYDACVAIIEKEKGDG